MIPHRLIRQPLFGGLLGLGLLALALVPSPAPTQANELSRDEEIAALKRQIAELTRKLEALEKAPAPTKLTRPEPALPDAWTKALTWRCIGPASMGGRTVAFAVYEADPTTYWIATASGGLLKTTNNGVTFEHQFDREATVSIGDVAVAPSNRDIVWVGTGENNPRNSVSYGDGVYKSTDGGKKWTHMGLKKSFQIGKIAIHPKNPDTVYVGALGRLYGPNEERGLYKTTDGGKSWAKILHVDDRTGVIDLAMHPSDPDTLLVATWERQRDGFDSHAGALAAPFNPSARVDPPLEDGYDAYDPIKKWGKGSGIWKTTDGGKTFKRLTTSLPGCAMGRIGLDYYRKDPRIVFAIIDSEMIGKGTLPGYLGVSSDDDKPARLSAITPNSPAAAAGLRAGDVITAVDKTAITTYDQLTRSIRSHRPGDRVTLSLTRDGKPMTIAVTLAERSDPDAPPRRPQLGFAPQQTPEGVKVTTLIPTGAADQAGMKVGDIITRLGEQKVAALEDLTKAVAALKPGEKVLLQVQRDGKTVDLTVNVPQPRGRSATRPYGFQYGGQRPNVQDDQGPDSHQYGGVYKSTDGGETWVRINSVNPRPMYFSQVRVDPSDDKLVYVLGVNLYRSTDGGVTFRPGGDSGVHPDHHAMWINPRDGRHILIGTDGGTYVSYDRCAKWDYLNTQAIGQFYHCCVDNRRPYRVYGGMQDNGSWGGPSHTLDGQGPINADWVMVQGGDGFVCRVDPTNPDLVYSESQEGNMMRRNLRTGEQASLKPRAPAGQPPYRFNWNTPFILSHHNPSIFYCAGNHVFRSVKRGAGAKVVSPEITRTGKGSATALAESRRNPDVLWVGTDDGNLWVTRDGGASWANVASKIGLPKPFWVATIEPSLFADGRCYVCFDGHRSDDDDPHLYVTEDFGQTWKSLRGNLPAGSSRVLREDLFNGDVLYLGTEFAVWASIDRGGSWTRINNNLPTVAVHELAQHPTAGEMVAATHGRSLWVLDVTALRQLKPAMAKEVATLLAPGPAVHWRRELRRGTIYGTGNREYAAENPQPGAHLYYALAKKADKLRLSIQDYTGKTVTTLQAPNGPGLHRVNWNLRPGRTQGLGMDFFIPSRLLGAMAQGGVPVPAGQYRVVLSVDGKEYSQGLKVENDPTLGSTPSIAEEEQSRRRRPILDD